LVILVPRFAFFDALGFNELLVFLVILVPRFAFFGALGFNDFANDFIILICIFLGSSGKSLFNSGSIFLGVLGELAILTIAHKII